MELFKPLSDIDIDLTGCIDLHIHPAPDLFPRKQHYLDIANDARDAGMKAICLKPLGSFPTMQIAMVAEKIVRDIKVFGGIVLDNVVGGLNPQAVKIAIKMGAKVVWMPLFDSEQTVTKSRKSLKYYRNDGFVSLEKGLEIWDEQKSLLPEVIEIIDLIAEACDIILDTSHLSPAESIVLIKEAKRRGVEKIVVSHPVSSIIDATIEQQIIMAKEGAIMNHVFASCSPYIFDKKPQQIVKAIRAVGADRCVISSDAGHVTINKPVEAFRQFITVLMYLGITEEEINIMASKNPAYLLGIN